MRVGLVCPYAFDVPGGVQSHVRDLAEELIAAGHEVSVLAPAEEEDGLPPYVVPAGRTVPIPYNGSVARLLLGPVSAARVRRWLRDGEFDVLHVHEPTAPSISVLACWFATGPMVVTHHNSTERSRALLAFEPVFVTALEKAQGRIAVSEAARATVVGHMGAGAVVIPNGVATRRFAEAVPLPGGRDGRTCLFLGRIDEPRKGLTVLLAAFREVVAQVPQARLVVAGPGDTDEVRAELPVDLRDRVELLGLVSEELKCRLLASADLFIAPNLGGESFGIVLTEAMAAGACVVASDLAAFARVLGEGAGGRLVPTGDSDALAAAVISLLRAPAERARLVARARELVTAYDWKTVAARIVEVYETVAAPEAVVAVDLYAPDLEIPEP